jgi:hypothetical protein
MSRASYSAVMVSMLEERSSQMGWEEGGWKGLVGGGVGD